MIDINQTKMSDFHLYELFSKIKSKEKEKNMEKRESEIKNLDESILKAEFRKELLEKLKKTQE